MSFDQFSNYASIEAFPPATQKGYNSTSACTNLSNPFSPLESLYLWLWRIKNNCFILSGIVSEMHLSFYTITSKYKFYFIVTIIEKQWASLTSVFNIWNVPAEIRSWPCHENLGRKRWISLPKIFFLKWHGVIYSYPQTLVRVIQLQNFSRFLIYSFKLNSNVTKKTDRDLSTKC